MHITRFPRPLRRLIPLSCVAAALVATACLDTTSNLPPSATVKFINVSGYPSDQADSLVNVYINGSLANVGALPFFSGVALYSGAISNAVPIEVRSAVDTTKSLAAGTFPLAVDSSYNLIFVPSLSGSTTSGGTYTNGHQLVYLPDTVQESLTNMRFQLVNAATRYGDSDPSRQVDVYLVPREDVTVTTGKVNTTPVPFLGVMPYYDVPGVAGDTAYRAVVVKRHSDGTVLVRDSVLIDPGYVTMLILSDSTGTTAPQIFRVDIYNPLR